MFPPRRLPHLILFGLAASDVALGAGEGPEHRVFAMRQRVTTEVRRPAVLGGGWLPVETETLTRVEWAAEGDALRWTTVPCAVASSKVFGATTTYPDALVASLGPRERAGRLQGERFVVGPFAQLVGLELDDPVADDFPTDPADERVRDTDGDGFRGVTVRVHHPMVGEGEVRVAQRVMVTFTGVAAGPGRYEGEMRAISEELQVDATTWWLRGSRSTRPTFDPARNRFELVEVPAATTCAEIADPTRAWWDAAG